MSDRFPEPGETLLAALATGVAAGLAAAFATSLFQTAFKASPLGPLVEDLPVLPPPTEVLAGTIYHSVTGTGLTGMGKTAGGEAVHYLTGAGLGMAYALLGRRWPGVSAARGAAYGIAVWATVEETGLALLELKPPPWRVEPAEHSFAAASHLVFGLALEAVFGTRYKPEAMPVSVSAPEPNS